MDFIEELKDLFHRLDEEGPHDRNFWRSVAEYFEVSAADIREVIGEEEPALSDLIRFESW